MNFPLEKQSPPSGKARMRAIEDTDFNGFTKLKSQYGKFSIVFLLSSKPDILTLVSSIHRLKRLNFLLRTFQFCRLDSAGKFEAILSVPLENSEPFCNPPRRCC
jgi:hypothetical protein